MSVEPEYLTTAEVGKRLKWSARTMRAKIAAGVFVAGKHFFQPPGCQLRWKWTAIVAWLEGTHESVVDSEPVRLARSGGRELV